MAALVVAGGCASAPKSSGADAELRLAAQAIESGRPQQAQMWLDRARAQYRGAQPEYVTLLEAEAKLRMGLTADALALVEEVLATDPNNAGANEVAGKILLKLGQYADAEQRFLAAQLAHSPDSAGFRRLEDYISLARGLDAYSKADPAVASRHFESIGDAQIRYAIDQAMREEAAR